MTANQAALIIMAKAPEPGLAKTRLIPALGPQGAAALAKRLLAHTIETARQASQFSRKELCATPAAHHLAFTGHWPAFVLTQQGEGDLGARMHGAFERVLAEFDAAVMIGTDAPAMSAQLLDQAALELDRHDAVFVPALDGGYTLIGLRRLMPELFVDMPWSTDQVMTITRDRLRNNGTRWHEYPPMADIDEPPDLLHLPAGWLP